MKKSRRRRRKRMIAEFCVCRLSCIVEGRGKGCWVSIETPPLLSAMHARLLLQTRTGT